MKKVKTIFCFIILFTFTINAHVKLTNPVGGETFSPGEQFTINWVLEIDHGDAVWDLYYSIDGGTNWVEIVTGLSKSTLSYNWTVPEVETSTAKIRVVQNNNDYTNLTDESDNFTITTATGIEKNKLPSKFEIIAQYPNPFNSTTNIEFRLSESSQTEMSIYNLLGQKIETIMNRKLNSGTHKIRYSSEKLTSGIYLVKINTEFNSKTLKIIYNK